MATGPSSPKALLQGRGTLGGVGGRMMAGEHFPHPRTVPEPMPGDFVQAHRVGKDFRFGDPHRQHLADVRPGDRVEVQAMADEAFHIDMTIQHHRGVEVGSGQRQQMGSLAFVALLRRFLEVAEHAHVGDPAIDVYPKPVERSRTAK